MSAQLAPRPVREAPKRRPSLRALDAPATQAGLLPFLLVMAAILATGMVGMVVLATALQDQGFAVQDKQHQAAALANQVSQLEAELADARSIKNVAISAQVLGMKPDPYTVSMRLSDGKVFGTPRTVLGNEMPGVRYLTDAQAAAEIAALNKAEADRIARLKAAAAAKKAADAAKAAQDAQAAQNGAGR